MKGAGEEMDMSHYTLSRPAMLVIAVESALRWAQNASVQRDCPAKFQIGERPSSHPPQLMGTTCEPWLNREAISALEVLLLPQHKVLEWSSGSGSLWALRRTAHVHTVEHNSEWLTAVRAKVESAGLTGSWTVMHEPCRPIRRKSCDGWAFGQDSVNDYSRYETAPQRVGAGPWDLVVVDGRSRRNCTMLAVGANGGVPLVNSKANGLVLIDNAERRRYLPAAAHIPRSWLCVEFKNRVDTTVLWMACEASDGPSGHHCARAKRELTRILTAAAGGRGRSLVQPPRSGWCARHAP